MLTKFQQTRTWLMCLGSIVHFYFSNRIQVLHSSSEVMTMSRSSNSQSRMKYTNSPVYRGPDFCPKPKLDSCDHGVSQADRSYDHVTLLVCACAGRWQRGVVFVGEFRINDRGRQTFVQQRPIRQRPNRQCNHHLFASSSDWIKKSKSKNI